MGVCVYEMVALKLPFDAPQMQQLVYKIINDQVFKIHSTRFKKISVIFEGIDSKFFLILLLS